MKLTDAFTSILGISNKSCPDCGAPLNSEKCCDECGYGDSYEDDESEDESEEFDMNFLLEIRDDLDRLKRKIDQLITKS